MNRILKYILIIIGLLLVVDAVGSILVYETQPWWPDHSVRILRAGFGTAIAYIGWRF